MSPAHEEVELRLKSKERVRESRMPEASMVRLIPARALRVVSNGSTLIPFWIVAHDAPRNAVRIVRVKGFNGQVKLRVLPHGCGFHVDLSIFQKLLGDKRWGLLSNQCLLRPH